MGALNILYDSESYCVAEFAGDAGVELMDKQARRSVYLEGALADQFRATFRDLFSSDTLEEDVDEFLGRYGELPTQPIVLH